MTGENTSSKPVDDSMEPPIPGDSLPDIYDRSILESEDFQQLLADNDVANSIMREGLAWMREEDKSMDDLTEENYLIILSRVFPCILKP